LRHVAAGLAQQGQLVGMLDAFGRHTQAQRPVAPGLTVTGMPIGSPRMDGPEYGGRRDAYEVLLVQRHGSHRVFASYPGKVI
jgi:hypothetical protein